MTTKRKPPRLPDPVLLKRAAPARETLNRALLRVLSAGLRTPCMIDPALWTDEPDRRHRTARQEAAEACGHCPIITECHAYAEVAEERWHVWGGVNRDALND